MLGQNRHFYIFSYTFSDLYDTSYRNHIKAYKKNITVTNNVDFYGCSNEPVTEEGVFFGPR